MPRGIEPTDDQLRATFRLDAAGPNPLYRCTVCAETELGVRNCLADHWRTHQAATFPNDLVDPTACPDCIGMGCDACDRTGDADSRRTGK